MSDNKKSEEMTIEEAKRFKIESQNIAVSALETIDELCKKLYDNIVMKDALKIAAACYIFAAVCRGTDDNWMLDSIKRCINEINECEKYLLEKGFQDTGNDISISNKKNMLN